MTRDFTEENKQKLLDLVKEVEPETWYEKAGDWVGDRWLDFEGWIGALDVQDYISEVDKYHKKVIDKNNTAEKTIRDIFENVNAINTQYVACFTSLHTQLSSYTQQIVNLAITIDPQNGFFNSEFIGNGLKKSLEDYLEKKAVLDAINSDQGLTEETLKDLEIDNQSCQEILEMYGNIILDNTPNVSIGDELQVPIGPGMVFYYKVSGEVKGEGNFDLNYVIEDQKLKLKKYGFKTDDILGINAEIDSEGKVTINSSGEHYSSSVSNDGGKFSYKVKIGDNTYVVTCHIDPITGILTYEESVITETDDATVSSTLGVKKSDNTGWQHMPDPVPITSPYTTQIPEFDIDWQEVEKVVVTAAGVVVVIGGVALLITATGGSGALVFLA